MNPDEALTTALHQLASETQVSPAPIEAVVQRGRAIRRRRRTAALTMVAAVVAPTCLLAARSAHLSVPAAGTASASAPAHTRVHLMMPGEQFSTLAGTTLWLSRQGLYLTSPAHPAPSPDSLLVADTAPGHVEVMMAGTGARSVWAGIYRGPGTPDKITLTLDGHALQPRLYTLPGHPGWVAFAADTAASHSSVDKPTIRIYTADGTMLLSTRP